MSNLKRRRANLMREDPHCYWCGCEVVYFELKRHQTMPPNFATIDHINSRLLNPDGRPSVGQQVLACSSCNEARNQQEASSLPLEELWRRAGRYPQESILVAAPKI